MIEALPMEIPSSIQLDISEMNVGGNGWQLATADEFQISGWKTLDPSSQTFAPFPS